MKIDELTIGQVKEIKNMLGESGSKGHSFIVGEKYLIRSVTYFHVGRIKAITDSDLLLSEASWVADTGRFYTALTTGELNEIEPFVDDVIVSRGAIVDATIWRHDLPKKQK